MFDQQRPSAIVLPSLISSLALFSSPVGLFAQGKIEWEKDLATARARAEKEGRLLVACISMKGERVCDVIVAEHYNDPKVVALSRKTVNVFCSPHGTKAQQEMEKRVRIDLLNKGADDYMVAPQHVFFTPGGKILKSVSYYVSPGELEWMWVEALRSLDKDFAWELSDRVRAPRQLKLAKVETSKKVVKPPTKKELDAILREIKRGFGGYYGASEKLPVIVRHPSGPARKFVERILKSLETSERQRITVLQTIAKNSPRIWYGVVTPMLSREHPGVREAAARALGELGERRAVRSLLARWRKEASPKVKGALLQAVVRCGPSNLKVIKLVPFVLKDNSDEDVRVHAAVAVAAVESRKTVTASLTAALADKSARVRATAAFSIAGRRDKELLPALDSAIERESDPDVKTWMAAARRVVAGGSMDAFAEFLKNVAKIE